MVEREAKREAMTACRLFVVALAAMSFCSVRVHGLDAVADLGCRSDDPAFDNGAVLTAAIRDGKVNDTVHFPGGAYYAATTADDCAKEGLALEGQGLTIWRSAGAYAKVGNASVRWVYIGPANQPAWRLRGVGTRMRGINIQRGHRVEAPKWDKSVGIEGTCVDKGPPSGKWNISHAMIAGFDTGIHFARSNHVDNIVFDHLLIQSCRRAVHSENPQTSGVEFRHLSVNGSGEIVFDIKAGGNFLVTTLTILEERLIWRFGAPGPGSNTGTYTVQNLKVDNNAAGWRLLEVAKPQTLNLHVSGHVGKQARPADDWIHYLGDWTGKESWRRVDVDLWSPGQALPPLN